MVQVPLVLRVQQVILHSLVNLLVGPGEFSFRFVNFCICCYCMTIIYALLVLLVTLLVTTITDLYVLTIVVYPSTTSHGHIIDHSHSNIHYLF